MGRGLPIEALPAFEDFARAFSFLPFGAPRTSTTPFQHPCFCLT